MKIKKIALFVLMSLSCVGCQISYQNSSLNTSISTSSSTSNTSLVSSNDVSSYVDSLESTSNQLSSFSTIEESSFDIDKSSNVEVSSITSSSSSQYEYTIDEYGTYTDKESVALYLVTYNRLPMNYVTKSEASKYDNSYSIGGDYFGNYEGCLSSKFNGSYRECDIDATKNRRGAKRLVYEISTFQIYYTEDHYGNFQEYLGYKKWSSKFGQSTGVC